MMLQSAKRSLLMGTDCFIVLVLIVEGVVLHFYVERVSTYVDCPPMKRLLLSFGLLCSPLLIYFLISSSTLCRQTELNTYGNIVGRRGLEFLRSMLKNEVLFRSTLRLPDILLEVFAIQMSYGLA